MKVSIEAESQNEFDLKRADLIFRLAGDFYEVDIVKAERESNVEFQDELFDHFNKRFEMVLGEIKKEILKVIK